MCSHRIRVSGFLVEAWTTRFLTSTVSHSSLVRSVFLTQHAILRLLQSRTRARRTNCPSCFDTGSQVTSLSEEGWAVVAPAVDVSKWKLSEEVNPGAINYTFLKVHGLSMPVYLSTKNAKGANILGSHFAEKAGVTFVGAYAQGGCLLASGDRPLVEQLSMLPRI
jgi:hypothetical protein